jgi:hypothetical protein
MKMILKYLLFFMFSSIAMDVVAVNNSMFTITGDMCKPIDTKAKVGSSKMLSCPSYHQTTNYTCGPAAVMALMRYYGKFNSSQMNHATEMRIADEMGADPNAGGTNPGQVASWLSSHGFSVDSSQNVSADIIKDNINKHVPVIVAYENHWILARGYDNGSVVFADSCCGTRKLEYNTIDSMWTSAHLYPKSCGGNMGYYIIAVPN